MTDYDYDLVTIGAGSGGVRASRIAAGLGARVAIVEAARLGGTCINAGCVPKKLFSYAAQYPDDMDDARGYGWQIAPPAFDWPTLVANKDREIARLNGVYERVLTGAGVAIVAGRATLVDAHTVAVGERSLTARHILVATGGAPVVPPIPGAELAITSDDAFHLPRLPKRVLVVGGGYIAVEFASIFNGLGVRTILGYRGQRLLRAFDEDLGPFLAKHMQAKGVQVRLGMRVERIERAGGALACTLDDGSVLEVDAVMLATGRAPNTRGIGLEAAGVRLEDDGSVAVDDGYASSVPSIHAIGDVIRRPYRLTPVALAEGMALAQRLFGRSAGRVDYANIPSAVFSHPNVSSVGLSEAQARATHGDVAVYRTTFTPLRHRLTGSREETLMKLVVDRATDRVLGVHMVGAEAGETVQGFAVALVCGATKRQFDATVGIHPTAAEEFVTMREAVA